MGSNMDGLSDDGLTAYQWLSNRLTNRLTNGLTNRLINRLTNGLNNRLTNMLTNRLINRLTNGLNNGLNIGLLIVANYLGLAMVNKYFPISPLKKGNILLKNLTR